ncbi:oxygenase MpaB family protein [Pseudonocardia sp. HH130630-07]|uniref:oxygenase MpaB family protein n=1 Tax=Pseudonocardia sp. HH130630-07 TaxID=1690815 RepID=UPI0008153A2C|nr:oxygenase MpaB family protein [Pseudonocardia sp. HH130630-07]ANY07377.1 L-aspartate oxidase [Pseudonocardia sp. HH130630-07]
MTRPGRYDRRDALAAMDPETDYVEIYRDLAGLEFPWDIQQALSLALFRTYAVPSIGRLLAGTGEFTGRVQKRYDDTALILESVLANGFDHVEGRAGIRRMNQMHRSYDISNDDMRYVLATFVVVPLRWVDRWGWRRHTEVERVATANYYRRLGRHMGIRDVPATWQEFGALLDAYEGEHFGYDPGGRAVADATLDLATTFPPTDRLPKRAARGFVLALMDPPLLDALGYRFPPAPVRRAADALLRARGAVVRRMPVRTEPYSVPDSPNIRSYPQGYDVRELGTFPACPVHRQDTAV